MSIRRIIHRILWALFALALAACSAAATPQAAPTQSPAGAVQTQVVGETRVVIETPIVQATEAPKPTAAAQPTLLPAPTEAPSQFLTATPAAGGFPTLAPTVGALASPTPIVIATEPPQPTATAIVEGRVIELEWPPRMRLGDSESVRLALVPDVDGYTVTGEFPDNKVVTQTVSVPRPEGYELFGVARLEGVGFQLAPETEQITRLPPGEAVTWRWTLTPLQPGQHRLNVNLFLHWVPPVNSTAPVRDSQIYSRSLTIEVMSFLGLTSGQAMMMGMFGLVFGGVLSLSALLWRRSPPAARRPAPAEPDRNPALVIEPPPGLTLADDERDLLQMVFRRYARAVIETEFRSGYSGARALLALPVRPDGRADAHTIVKIGERRAIEREFQNYQAYVKDTLPPITARIQDEPVVAPGPGPASAPPRAAIRYTFIAEPGQRPISLGEALRAKPDPALLNKLFETFGPNWWMQRRAHAFRVAQEYDRLLPAHYVLEPVTGRGSAAPTKIDERSSPAEVVLSIGALVTVGRFNNVEVRQDGQSLSLLGEAAPGQPPIRLRWQSRTPPEGTTARVVATRDVLLRQSAAAFDRLDLPDPLLKLPGVLVESMQGSLSTIHGDLNLENVLVGPGGFVWLIDFAQTRDGHPLFDFAHLEAGIIAQVLAPQFPNPADYLAVLKSNSNALLTALHNIAARCLFNPGQPREYTVALYLACLGALKYVNLGPHGKHLLYLTAAHLAQTLPRTTHSGGGSAGPKATAPFGG
jgi:hypothetical protein